MCTCSKEPGNEAISCDKENAQNHWTIYSERDGLVVL